VLEKYGYRCEMSDLAIITGCHMGKNDEFAPFGTWMVVPRDDSYFRKVVNGVGFVDLYFLGGYCRRAAVRPVLKLSSSKFYELTKNRFHSYLPKTNQNALSCNYVDIVKCFEYPQYVVDSQADAKELNNLLKKNSLEKTGRVFHLDNTLFDCKDLDELWVDRIKTIDCEEYLYKGKKYICASVFPARVPRKLKISDYGSDPDLIYPKDGYHVELDFVDKVVSVISDTIKHNKEKKGEYVLSDKKYYRSGEKVWIKVSPVEWLIDDKTKTLICKNGLLSSVPFTIHSVLNFSDTHMSKFLNDYMLKDMMQEDLINLNSIQTNKNNGIIFRTIPNDTKSKVRIRS